MTDTSSRRDTAAKDDTSVSLQAAYTLGILFLIYVVSYFDRQIMSILMEPIRRELLLSDSQLGFISGFGFFFFYAVCGIPIARFADRTSRRNVIAACLTVWSLMTAFCGTAQGFLHLLIGRIGVAAGEGGGGPSSHSMISDLFAHGRRSTALAIYSCGVPVGVLIGLAVGGWINQNFDWRTTFFAACVPGLLLALVLLATVKEPARTGPVAPAAGGPGLIPIAEARQLWAIPSFRRMAVAASLSSMVSYGLQQWNPTYLIRSFQLGTADVGLQLGLIIGIAGALGVFCGGFVADRLGRRDERWYAWVPAIANAATVPFYFVVYLADTPGMALAAIIVPSFVTNMYLGPSFGTVQSLAPVRMRATAAAVLLFIMSAGQAVGPQAVGLMSDLYAGFLGADALRWSMISLMLFKIAVVWSFVVAARDLSADLAAASRAAGDNQAN